MTSSREEDERVMEILAGARRKPAAEREAYLLSACAGDEELRREVVEALGWEERMGGFLQQPVGLIPDESAQPDDGVMRPVLFTTGLQVGQYRIESKLGAGGMSTVYLALDTKLHRHVAIKVLSDHLADAEARRRFQREAQMASSLNHPHIITVHDVGEFEGRQYLVMEYVDGGTLKDWAKEKKRTPKEIAALLTGVADGLAAAHEAGILHRDVKPTNILIARNGYAKLADFGLAKVAPSDKIEVDPTWSVLATQKGAVFGTVAYMSPEQASGEALDSRSDIFSFAVVLYELLSGKRPFGGKTDLEVLKTIIHGDLPPLNEDTPATYQIMVEKALEKNPTERYQSMREMVVDLKRAQRPTVSTLPRTTPPPPRAWNGLAALAIAIVAVGIIAMVWQLLRPLPRPRISGIGMITNDGQAKFGPMATDGSRIYFNELLPDPRNVVSQVSVKGGEAIPISIPLPTPAVLDVSKDGTMLLVASGVLANSLGVEPASLWLQPVAGGSPQRVGTILAVDARFGPDGTIIYVDGQSVNSVSSDGASPRKLLSVRENRADWRSNPFAFRFSPDARDFRFTQPGDVPGTSSIMEAAADGTNLHRLFSGCCGEWTADGGTFIFQSRTGLTVDLWALRERRRFPWSRLESKPFQLTSGPLDFQFPLPGKDGKQIFAIGTSRRSEVVRYDSSTGHFVPFLAGVSASELAFSRDAQWVAYTSYPGKILWRSRVDGSERTQLTFPPMRALRPQWSPDGKQIAFSADQPGMALNIYVISSEGGAAQRILPNENTQMDLSWSPDGNSLAFGSHPFEKAPIYTIDVRTKRVAELPGSTGIYAPRWSPDGKYIAAITMPNSTLTLFDFSTQSWTEVFGYAMGWPNWSHDGKYIYFLSYQDPHNISVLRLRLSDRRIEHVVDVKEMGRLTTGAFGHSLGLTPDDSPLFPRDISTQEIYALQVEWP